MDSEFVDGELIYWNIPDQTTKDYNFETRLTALKQKTQNKITQTLLKQRQKAENQLQKFEIRNQIQTDLEVQRLNKIQKKMKKVNQIELNKIQEKNYSQKFIIENRDHLFKVKAKQQYNHQIQNELEKQFYQDQQRRKLYEQEQKQQEQLNLIKQIQIDKKNQLIKKIKDNQIEEQYNVRLQKKQYAKNFEQMEQEFKQLNLRQNTIDLISNHPKKISRQNQAKSVQSRDTISQADLPYFKNLI